LTRTHKEAATVYVIGLDFIIQVEFLSIHAFSEKHSEYGYVSIAIVVTQH